MTHSQRGAELHFEPPVPAPGGSTRCTFRGRQRGTGWRCIRRPSGAVRASSPVGYGMLIDGLQMAYVNGFGYMPVRPAPEARSRALPAGGRGLRAEVLARAASRVERDVQAGLDKAHREIQAVDPDTLSDDELVTHLRVAAITTRR